MRESALAANMSVYHSHIWSGRGRDRSRGPWEGHEFPSPRNLSIARDSHRASAELDSLKVGMRMTLGIASVCNLSPWSEANVDARVCCFRTNCYGGGGWRIL